MSSPARSDQRLDVTNGVGKSFEDESDSRVADCMALARAFERAAVAAAAAHILRKLRLGNLDRFSIHTSPY